MKIIKFLDKNLEEIVCSTLLSIIVILLGFQVFFRFFFSKAWSWHEEIIRFSFVWFCYFGVSLGAKKMKHIRVTVFRKMFPDSFLPAIKIVSDIIWIFFNIVVVLVSVTMLSTMLRFNLLSPALNWNMFYLYLIIPISFSLTTFRILQNYYRKKTNEKE